ncbi:MAG: hypothetical protein UT19_C0007G0007 [Candidatus Woesebacteria bacterium GW2011_GWB1_39_10b]|nr:MAG: hypothetical protein US72_C0007G0036 [Microgenomates group bacterium GW2011_GWC1_38_12]KKQ93763.1 MAG: hypothetical protein UT19_C0007G0007 [Candidatus Woesebacteria bacterium GW2011_GWB1_39_10b]KKR14326.1 MAG: hypothetical protein UT40_C0002G0005 [Candidatus Woesebacteria bacterium GW2011_GWA1_39_21b]
MDSLPLPDTRGGLIYLKEWRDNLTDAQGWLARWGDPNLNVSGGGIRMKINGMPEEAVFLASTMYEKFGIAGPEINGSKFVIDYDPNSPDKMSVLSRFIGSFLHELENVGTAGDLGVSEEESAEVLRKHGIDNPQFGILNGLGLLNNLGRLGEIMHTPLQEKLSPKHERLVDIAAGWSAFISLKTYYELKGGTIAGKTIALQGVGAVGGSAGFYLEKAGAIIVAVADREGSLSLEGRRFEDVVKNVDPKTGCLNRRSDFETLGDSQAVLNLPADALVVAATSEVIKDNNVGYIKAGVIVEGANHPITPSADKSLEENGILVLPDFIVNAGTAELFTIGMLGDCEISEQMVLQKIAQITRNAMTHASGISSNEGIPLREAARIVSTMMLWKQFV